ncbi:hypothetical protein CCFV1_ORF056 [Cotesia congregata filamentous virus 1]|uniref:Uncharacterized protein n=1 Tax=Cotesia congregata filamentous virus 1 TaxID=3064291 RepID=A0ABC8QPQ2_9VIRU|nr:hypothetical protein CCFV1_ORF056 [Cotesia congregata filamentous virus 1]
MLLKNTNYAFFSFFLYPPGRLRLKDPQGFEGVRETLRYYEHYVLPAVLPFGYTLANVHQTLYEEQLNVRSSPGQLDYRIKLITDSINVEDFMNNDWSELESSNNVWINSNINLSLIKEALFNSQLAATARMSVYATSVYIRPAQSNVRKLFNFVNVAGFETDDVIFKQRLNCAILGIEHGEWFLVFDRPGEMSFINCQSYEPTTAHPEPIQILQMYLVHVSAVDVSSPDLPPVHVTTRINDYLRADDSEEYLYFASNFLQNLINLVPLGADSFIKIQTRRSAVLPQFIASYSHAIEKFTKGDTVAPTIYYIKQINKNEPFTKTLELLETRQLIDVATAIVQRGHLFGDGCTPLPTDTAPSTTSVYIVATGQDHHMFLTKGAVCERLPVLDAPPFLFLTKPAEGFMRASVMSIHHKTFGLIISPQYRIVWPSASSTSYNVDLSTTCFMRQNRELEAIVELKTRLFTADTSIIRKIQEYRHDPLSFNCYRVKRGNLNFLMFIPTCVHDTVMNRDFLADLEDWESRIQKELCMKSMLLKNNPKAARYLNALIGATFELLKYIKGLKRKIYAIYPSPPSD